MKNKPDKVFLQVGEYEEPDDFNELAEVTWCRDRIDENDIEYVSAEKLNWLLEKYRSRLLNEFNEAVNAMSKNPDAQATCKLLKAQFELSIMELEKIMDK